MKKVFVTSLAAFGLFAMVFTASAAEKKAKIKVPTLVCETCVATITKAVKAVDGVSAVSVSQKEKTAVVTFDDEKTSQAKIEAAITKVGYNAGEQKRDKEAFDKLSPCCKADDTK
jgi:copper chaperone CopZ